jgi:hypothetical protein
VISNVVGRHPSGSCASRRVTLSRGAASHPQRRHYRQNEPRSGRTKVA